MSAFEFLSSWYQAPCDGEWQHQHGVRIAILDYPGWHVRSDLAETLPESSVIEYPRIESSESDRFGYSVSMKVFSADGDLQKPETLISKSKEIAER